MRLTKQDSAIIGGYDYVDELDNLDPIVNKLGRLEDIEDELGIDLVIFKKIKEQGFIYGKYKNEIRKFTANHFTFDNILAYTKLGTGSWLIRVKFPFKDYGKSDR